MSALPSPVWYQDRRTHPRLPPRSGVSVCCQALPMPSQDLAVVLMNVSQGGACLALRQNLPLGRRVHVAFVIEGTPTYYAEGTVVWTAGYFHGLHLVGVRFDVPLQAGETIWLGGRA